MKYKTIVEDTRLLSCINLSELSRDTGVSREYLSSLRAGKAVASERLYKKLKNHIVKKYLTFVN